MYMCIHSKHCKVPNETYLYKKLTNLEQLEISRTQNTNTLWVCYSEMKINSEYEITSEWSPICMKS